MYSGIMRSLGLVWMTMAIGINIGNTQQPGLVVNEVGLSNGNKFIELVVTGQPCQMVDLRGWIIDDNNGTFTTCGTGAPAGAGISTGHIRFSNNVLWEDLPVGMMIVIYDDDEDQVGDLCDDWLIEVCLSCNDGGFGGISNYFVEDDTSPAVANGMDPCDNRLCGRGNNSYLNNLSSNVTSDDFGLNSPIGLNNLRDGIQIRNGSGIFQHGFAWGTPDAAGCTLGYAMTGGPGFYFLNANNNISLMMGDAFSAANYTTGAADSPGEANSQANAEWIRSMRSGFDLYMRDNDCLDFSIIDSISLCLLDDRGNLNIEEIIFSACPYDDYLWTVENGSEDVLEIVDENLEIVSIQGRSRGIGFLNLEITSFFNNLGYPVDPFVGTYRYRVEVNGFDGTLAKNDAIQNLCIGDCAEMIFTSGQDGAMDYDFVLRVQNSLIDDDFFFNNQPNNTIIEICLDEPGTQPRFLGNKIGIPTDNVGENLEIELIEAANMTTGCGAVSFTAPITYDLVQALNYTIPPPLMACPGEDSTLFDLTQLEDSISMSATYTWYFDSTALGPIFNPDSFYTSQDKDTVYVEVTEGDCTTMTMPICVQVYPRVQVSAGIVGAQDSIVCYADNSLFSGAIRFTLSGDSTLDFNLISTVDGLEITTSVTGINDSFVYTLPNVRDSAVVYLDSIRLSSTGCLVDVVSIDSFTLQVGRLPDLSFIPRSIDTCEYYIVPDFNVPGYDYLILSVLDNSQVEFGDTIFSSDVLFYTYFQGDCAELIEQNIQINTAPEAGTGMDSTICSEMIMDSLHLEDLIMNGEVGGRFSQIDGDTLNISPSNNIDISSASQGDYSFVYEVSEAGCPPDSAFITFHILSIGSAGQDVMTQATGGLLDLFPLFSQRDANGIFELMGNTITSPIDVSLLNPGTYDILHIVDFASCGRDTAFLQLEVIPCETAGLDTTLTECFGFPIIPIDLLRAGSLSGDFYDDDRIINGNQEWIHPDDTEDTILYVVGPMNGCPTDTSLIILESISRPEAAGQDTSVLISGGTLNLWDFLPSRQADGSLFSTVDYNTSIMSQQNFDPLIDGDYRFAHILFIAGCEPDTAFITITKTACVDAGLDTLISGCAQISIIPSSLTRQGGSGGRYFIGDLETDGNDAVLFGDSITQIIYVVDRPAMCNSISDSAIYRINWSVANDLGANADTMVCSSDIVDITEFKSTFSSVNYFFDNDLITDPTNFTLAGKGAGPLEILAIKDSPGCNIDTAVYTIHIQQLYDLGPDLDFDVCAGDTVNLVQLLNGYPNLPPEYSAVATIDANGILASEVIMIDSNIVISEQETRTFSYILESDICGIDTIHFSYNGLPIPEAGMDTTATQIKILINLYDFVPGRNADGLFLDSSSGALLNADLDLTNEARNSLTILHIVESTSCGIDSAFISLTLVPCPSAGLDSTIIRCGTFQIRPDSLLRNASSGLFFHADNIITGSDEFSVQEGDSTIISYIVENQNCPNDTAYFYLSSKVIPIAGQDIDTTFCFGQIVFSTLLDPNVTPGQWIDDNGNILPLDYVFDTDNFQPEEYEFSYVASNGICPDDESSLIININQNPSAGLDTVIVNCGTGNIVPRDFIRNGTEGLFLLENTVIPGDTSLFLEGMINTTIRHYHPMDGSCDTDTAYFQIINEPFPQAGIDIDTFTCDGAAVDLLSMITGGDIDGRFTNLSGDRINPPVELIDPIINRFRYVVSRGFCGTDNALITVRNLDVRNTVLRSSGNNLCANECLTVEFPAVESVSEYTVQATVVNSLTGNVFNGIIAVDNSRLMNWCLVDDGTEDFSNLAPNQSYILSFDTIVIPGFCSYPVTWDDIEIRTEGDIIVDFNPTLCSGEEVMVGPLTYTELNPSGMVVFPGGAFNGCDSIVLVDINYESFTFGSFSGELCAGGSVNLHGTTYSESNLMGMDTLIGASTEGCDSIVEVTFTVVNTLTQRIVESFCDPNAFVIVNGVTYNLDNPRGMEMIPGGSQSGCDSIVEIDLTFEGIGVNQIIIETCNTDLDTTINGVLYNFENRRGTDLFPGAAANGCDSLNEINLFFNELIYIYEVTSPPCEEDSLGTVEIMEWEGSLPVEISWSDQARIVDELPFSFQFPIGELILLELRDEDGCNGTQLVTIEPGDSFDIELQVESLGSNTFSLSVESAEPIATYSWYPSSNLTCTDCPSPQITLVDQDQFIYIDVVTESGCMRTDTAYLGFNEDDLLYAPNVFSPNEDGNNDRWTIYIGPASQIQVLEIFIYDRWGALVGRLDESAVNDINQGWDGGELNAGVYVYQVQYADPAGNKKYYNGDLTLVR